MNFWYLSHLNCSISCTTNFCPQMLFSVDPFTGAWSTYKESHPSMRLILHPPRSHQSPIVPWVRFGFLTHLFLSMLGFCLVWTYLRLVYVITIVVSGKIIIHHLWPLVWFCLYIFFKLKNTWIYCFIEGRLLDHKENVLFSPKMRINMHTWFISCVLEFSTL